MYSLRLYAAASSCADVGKKEEKNFFALSTYFHGRTQLLHIELENIEYRVSSYRPWNFGITKKWSILTKLKIAKGNINQNMTPFDILKVIFFRPTFFRPILKSGISTDYYCFNHIFKYKSKGIEVNGVGIHLI